MRNRHKQALINVFEYFDYRRYMADYYVAKKSLKKQFSYRSFARKAGYNSSGFYSDVVSGKRNLTDRLVPKFARAFDFNLREAEYFSHMVQFTHAGTAGARQDIFEAMVGLLPLKIQRLQKAQKDYFTHWLHVAVREVLAVLKVKENYRELAHFLDPPVTPSEAKSSVQLLFRLELIRRDEDGYWQVTHASIFSKGSEVGHFLIREFQGKMIRLGEDALERVSPEKRNISTTTMSISREGMERIRNKIESFHKDVVEIVRSDSTEDRVFQFNVQFFPLTRIPKVEQV